MPRLPRNHIRAGKWIEYSVLSALVILLLFCVSGFLSWQARVRHMHSGVGLNALKLDIIQYAEDNDDRLPPMGGRKQFTEALMPYAKSTAIFHAYDDPSRLILPNPRLSGRKVSEVTRLTVLLYESEPARTDGSRWVAFLPQNAVPAMFSDPDLRGLELVKEADWPHLKVADGIP